MPQVNIGLSSRTLQADALINAWEAVEDPERMVKYADTAITSLFQDPNSLWDLSRGMSRVCYQELVNSGGVVNRKLDKQFMSEAFRDGVVAASATFWAIREFSPSKGLRIPKFRVPDDFEPSGPDTLFMPNNPNFRPIIHRLISNIQETTQSQDEHYDPYFTVGIGAEYGAQFMTEMLALRHEMISADFALEEAHIEAGLPLIPETV